MLATDWLFPTTLGPENHAIVARGGFFVGIPNPTKKNPNPGDFKSHGIFTKKCGIPIPGIPRDFLKSPGFWEFPKNHKNEKKNPKMSKNEKKP